MLQPIAAANPCCVCAGILELAPSACGLADEVCPDQKDHSFVAFVRTECAGSVFVLLAMTVHGSNRGCAQRLCSLLVIWIAFLRTYD